MARDQRRMHSATPIQMTRGHRVRQLHNHFSTIRCGEVQKCCKKTQTHDYQKRDLQVGHLQPAWILAMSTYPAHTPIYINLFFSNIYIYVDTSGCPFLCFFLCLRLSRNNVDKVDNFSPNPISMRYTCTPT